MGPLPNFDLRPVFALAIFGLISGIALAAYGLWWLISHIRWVG